MAANSEPLVSVVVPVYKAERFLDTCVESILEQSHHNLQLILVDDGSPDSCPRICDAWADKDPRVIALHIKNSGASGARNAGMRRAEGDYLMFVDSDDVLRIDAVPRSLSIALRTGCELVIFGKQYIDEQDNALRITSIDHDVLCDSDSEKYYDQLAFLLRNNYLSSPWGKLFTRGIVEGSAFDVDMVYEEDLAFNIAVLRRKPSVYAMREPLYCYRHMDSGMASVYSERKVCNVVTANRLKDSLFAGKLGKQGLEDLSAHITQDIGWIVPQVTDAFDVPIDQRVQDIMTMAGDKTCRPYIIRGASGALLSKVMKMLMVLNNRWLWHQYTEMHDRRGRR